MFDVKELERIILENQSKVIETEGRTLVFGKYNEVKPPKYHTTKLNFEELSSIVTMIQRDNADLSRRLYIHIESPYSVSVFTEVDTELERDYLYGASFKGKQFQYGTWMDYETFVIALRAKFIETEDRNKLISLIASVRNVDDNEISDNGITQTATTKQGAGLVQTGEIKAIYRLCPYRTFNGIPQAEAEYLFRISQRNGKELCFAIFEADGGRWELEQKTFIFSYFESSLSKEIADGRIILVR